jgi:hypothetical protein
LFVFLDWAISANRPLQRNDRPRNTGIEAKKKGRSIRDYSHKYRSLILGHETHRREYSVIPAQCSLNLQVQINKFNSQDIFEMIDDVWKTKGVSVASRNQLKIEGHAG